MTVSLRPWTLAPMTTVPFSSWIFPVDFSRYLAHVQPPSPAHMPFGCDTWFYLKVPRCDHFRNIRHSVGLARTSSSSSPVQTWPDQRIYSKEWYIRLSISPFNSHHVADGGKKSWLAPPTRFFLHHLSLSPNRSSTHSHTFKIQSAIKIKCTRNQFYTFVTACAIFKIKYAHCINSILYTFGNQ